MTERLSGELLRQKSIEAELTKRRLESRRFNMRGYSMNLREIPRDGTLAVESSKLVVKTVQNFKVLCRADNFIDDDDEMIESALLTLAASKRQKDRAPSSMILHRHMQNRDSQQFSLQQNSIVHQKLKGQADLDSAIFQVQVKEAPVPRPTSVLPNVNAKIAVSPSFLQLFDLDSSRSGRTNEYSSNHADSYRRSEVCTPVKVKNDKMATDQHQWVSVPERPDDFHLPVAKRRSRTNGIESASTFHASNPILELAAPYSKNYVENYKSKIRHSRLGAGNIFATKNLVRLERTRNKSGAVAYEETTQRQILTHDFTAFESQRSLTADSILVSSPSRGSQDDFAETFEREADTCAQNCEHGESQFDTTPIFFKEDSSTDMFEVIERERMLEQVQNMYANVSIPSRETKQHAGFKNGNVGNQRERNVFVSSQEYKALSDHSPIVKEAASLKSIHVVMPRNETRSTTEQGHKSVDTHSEIVRAANERVMNKANIAVANHYRMSVNILRPFESIVDVAQRYCTSPAARMAAKTSQHATPVAVMFASESLMNM
jgi:hypothetical protein